MNLEPGIKVVPATGWHSGRTGGYVKILSSLIVESLDKLGGGAPVYLVLRRIRKRYGKAFKLDEIFNEVWPYYTSWAASVLRQRGVLKPTPKKGPRAGIWELVSHTRPESSVSTPLPSAQKPRTDGVKILLPLIVESLHKHGGKAAIHVILRDIRKRYAKVFKLDKVFRELWPYYAYWAATDMRGRGLLKSTPKEGTWELTTNSEPEAQEARLAERP